MIRADKLRGAMAALSFVLIRARLLAYEKASHEQIAKLLDVAELLPMLVVREEDLTEFYRGLLDSLSTIDRGCAHAVKIFDESERG